MPQAVGVADPAARQLGAFFARGARESMHRHAFPNQSRASSTALTWVTPRNWKTETPSSSMRRAQYRVPGPA